VDDHIDDSPIDYRAALLWQPKMWVGFGISYDSFAWIVVVDKD
jgi:hypothetical protein